MPTVVRSFCKINLGLAVGPARPDGFHHLTTLYQTLGLHDLVTVGARLAPVTRITLSANHPGVPCTAAGNPERNTAFRMVAGVLQRLGITAEVHLDIQKILPVQGGLGAGSANAAAALLGLERELAQELAQDADRGPHLHLPAPDRLELAAEVGSDVPLFLLGGTVLGLNRGEAVYPFPDPSPAIKPLPVVVAIPPVGVSTAEAFRDLDARMAAGTDPGDLTWIAANARLGKLSRVLASAWTPSGLDRETERAPTGIVRSSFTANNQDDQAGDPLSTLVRTGVENDFEDVAFRQHPSLRDIKCALAGPPDGTSSALYAALSGSGSALFGLYPSPEAALEAQQRVGSLGIQALLTETLTRREYWRQMFA